MSVLLDAGPSLNFLAVGQENILIQAATSANLGLAVPARVEKEILSVSQNTRFQRSPAEATWRRLRSTGHIDVLDDTLTTERDHVAAGEQGHRPAHPLEHPSGRRRDGHRAGHRLPTRRSFAAEGTQGMGSGVGRRGCTAITGDVGAPDEARPVRVGGRTGAAGRAPDELVQRAAHR